MSELNEEIILKNREVLADHYREVLTLLGENPEREG